MTDYEEAKRIARHGSWEERAALAADEGLRPGCHRSPPRNDTARKNYCLIKPPCGIA